MTTSAALPSPRQVTVPAAGSRVVVTGAAGGLGAALCETLRQLDCKVVGIDLPGRNTAGTEQVLGADLTDAAAVRTAFSDAGMMLGGLDAVVGAAGVVDTIHRAERFPTDEFEGDLAANLTAQFFVAQAAFPLLIEGDSTHSAIVFLSSLAALDGLPGQVAYAAAKAGVIGLTRSLAAEWAGRQIRVNAVAPGLIATPKVLALAPTLLKHLLEQVPIARAATLAEVVGTVLYLLSPAAGYTTGQVIRLDGGQGLAGRGLYRSDTRP